MCYNHRWSAKVRGENEYPHDAHNEPPHDNPHSTTRKPPLPPNDDALTAPNSHPTTRYPNRYPTTTQRHPHPTRIIRLVPMQLQRTPPRTTPPLTNRRHPSHQPLHHPNIRHIRPRNRYR